MKACLYTTCECGAHSSDEDSVGRGTGVTGAVSCQVVAGT